MRPKLHFARRRTSILTTFALSASFVAAGFVSAAPASAATPAEAKGAQYINRSRTSRGIRALTVSSSLTYLARKHSEAMASSGRIYHTTNLSGKLASYSWSVAGENVGKGPMIYSIHIAMMNSPSHRSNLLYRGYKRMGVGVAKRGSTWYITEIFMG